MKFSIPTLGCAAAAGGEVGEAAETLFNTSAPLMHRHIVDEDEIHRRST